MEHLTVEQEEALQMLYRRAGFEECFGIVNKYMVENFGKQHKHTIDLKLILQPILYKINDESRKMIDDSGLTDLYMRRLENTEKEGNRLLTNKN